MPKEFIKYGTAILLVLFIVFYFYNKGRQDEKFLAKIKEIETGRQQLEQQVKDLKIQTEERANKLKDQLKQELVILDTLNAALRRTNTVAGFINNQIDSTKKNIDDLWKNN